MNKLQFSNIKRRLHLIISKYTGMKEISTSLLAEELNVPINKMVKALDAKTLPLESLIIYCSKHSISMEWLFLGKGVTPDFLIHLESIEADNYQTFPFLVDDLEPLVSCGQSIQALSVFQVKEDCEAAHVMAGEYAIIDKSSKDCASDGVYLYSHQKKLQLGKIKRINNMTVSVGKNNTTKQMIPITHLSVLGKVCGAGEASF